MDARETDHQSRHGGIDAETVVDAVDVLHDIVEWELAPERWELVSTVLDRMLGAYQDGDAQALRHATAELELASPIRASLIGTKVLVGIPDGALDRQNALVHALVADIQHVRTDSRDTPDQVTADQPEAGDVQQRPS